MQLSNSNWSKSFQLSIHWKSPLPSELDPASEHQHLTICLNGRIACDVVVHFLRCNYDVKLRHTRKKPQQFHFFVLSVSYNCRLHVTSFWRGIGLHLVAGVVHRGNQRMCFAWRLELSRSHTCIPFYLWTDSHWHNAYQSCEDQPTCCHFASEMHLLALTVQHTQGHTLTHGQDPGLNNTCAKLHHQQVH